MLGTEWMIRQELMVAVQYMMCQNQLNFEEWSGLLVPV